MSTPPVTFERQVVLPEAGGAPSTAIDQRRALSPVEAAFRDRVPWPVPAALAALAVIVVLAFVLGRDREPAAGGAPADKGVATPADTIDVPPAAPNAVLAIGTADAFTSSILTDQGEDLPATLAANPSAAAGLGGSPVSGDAVVVQQVFGTDAFSVASNDGGTPILVYLPGAIDELQGFVPGSTQVLFSGTLHPTPPDLGDFLGYEPASVAARTGVYVVAVPATVMQVDPPTA